MEIAVCIMGLGCLALAGWAVRLASKQKVVSKEVWKEAVDVVSQATSLGQKEMEEKERRLRALVADVVEKVQSAAAPSAVATTTFPAMGHDNFTDSSPTIYDRSLGLDDAAVAAGDLGAP